MKKALALLLAALLLCALMPAVSLAETTHYTYTMAPYTTIPLGENTPLIDYMNERYNATFELIYIEESNRTTQIGLMAASDELPDVIYGGDAPSLLSQGLIGTWTEEFFREHAPRYSAMIDEYAPEAWALTKVDGVMYTLPSLNVEYLTAPAVFAWNGAWLEKLGVAEVPTDLEGLETLLYRMAKEDPDGNGQNDTYGLSERGMTAIYGAYGFQRNMWLDDGTGNVVRGDVMPQAKEALALLAKWYKDGVLDPEFITGENQGGYWALTHAFINQRIACTDMGNWYHWIDLTSMGLDYLAPNTKAIAESDKPFPVVYAHPPIGPEGKCGTIRSNPANTRNTFSEKLVAETDRFARLLEIFDDMTMDLDTAIMKWYGFEGTDWVYEEVNGIKTIKDLAHTELDRGMEGLGTWWSFVDGSVEFLNLKNAKNLMFVDKFLSEWTTLYYQNAVPQTLPSGTLYWTECDKILNEGYIAIITGEKPIDYFDEMVQSWYNAGGQTLTDEANEIYHQK